MPINPIDIANTGLSFPNLLLTVVLTIGGSIIISLIDGYLKSIPNRRKTNIWINFLKNDKYISECIEQYYEIESPRNTWAIIAVPMGYFVGVLGYVAFIFLSALIFQIFGIKSWSLAYPSLIISFLAFIYSVLVRLNIEKITDDETPLNSSEHIALKVIFVNWFIFASFFIAIGFPTLLIIYTGAGISIINPLYISAFSIGFFAMAAIISFTNRRHLLNDVKDLLNDQYFKQYVVETFPYVHIKIDSMVLEGKVFDIFNDDMIILDDFGVKKAVEWDSIKYMELKR